MDDQPAAAAPPAVTIAPGHGTVVVLNNDLIFGSRILSGLGGAGYRVVLEKTWERFESALRTGEPVPVLGIIDMNPVRDWDKIGGFARDDSRRTPLLGFGPHVDIAGRRAAKAAGLERIVSNGEFHRGMVEIVRRYALPVARRT